MGLKIVERLPVSVVDRQLKEPIRVSIATDQNGNTTVRPVKRAEWEIAKRILLEKARFCFVKDGCKSGHLHSKFSAGHVMRDLFQAGAIVF